MTGDASKTWDLVLDVLQVFGRYGYDQADSRRTGEAALVILDLIRMYEGADDIPGFSGGPPAPHRVPGRPAAEAGHGTVTLSRAEVSTVAVALAEASDYKRDRAATCADCADQSCGTCQWRLQAAQVYDQLAIGMLQAAQTSRAAARRPPGPRNPGIEPGQADPGTGKEAGQ